VHVHLDYPAAALRWPLAAPPDLLVLCAKSLLPLVTSALASEPSQKHLPKIRVIQNAIDVERFQPVEKSVAKRLLGFDPATPLAVMVANLAKHKGQETALQALAIMKERGASVRLALIGEERGGATQFTSHLRKMRDELGVGSHVDFLGFRTDVPQLLGAADFLLLPSTSEALPLTILEAQAAKTVVLAAPTADIPDVVHDGSTGFLIPADDPEGYADRMAALVANPSLGAAIVDRAHTEVVRRFALQAYCQAVLDEYEALFD
jgi:glycosyltransferase involved in cell wall biosynthesis